MSIFKACDIRGVVGDEWDVEDAGRIGRELGRLIRREGDSSVCIGGDSRRSTPRLKAALIAGLGESRLHIHDVGQLPTPAVYFAARQLACNSVAIVTASHNPGRYNGVKFMIAGRPAGPQWVRQLCTGVDPPAEACGLSRIETHDMQAAYEVSLDEQSRQLVESTMGRDSTLSKTSPASFSIVVDTMAGACTPLASRVLKAAGHRVWSLSDTIDPDFAERAPNPASDANLARLITAVGERQADVGIGLDGDGDRVILVDHTGAVVRPEQIAALLIRYGPPAPTVVYDLKCASIVPREVSAAGGRSIMRPSGHGFIKATMIDEHALWGAEVSGHHFFAALDGGDDGLFTAMVILRLMSACRASLSDLIAPIGWPAITPDLRIAFSGDATATLAGIASACGGCVSQLDGVRADYDGGWGLARASITEPAITLRFEGADREHLHQIAARFLAAQPELLRQVMERIDA